MRNAGYADSSLDDDRPELPVAAAQRLRHPLQPERLHPAEHRRLRVLERRRRLGQQHGAAHDQQRRRATRSAKRASRNARIAQPEPAFNGRRLCEGGVGLYEEVGLATGRRRRGRSHRVGQPDPHVETVGDSPYYIQEACTPTTGVSWRLRKCVRQAYNTGVPRSGTCVRSGTGLDLAASPG